MDRVNIYPNERVGITDYENGAGGKLVRSDQFREAKSFIMPAGRGTGSTATEARIFGGFNFDTINYGVDQTATLNRGTGILPFLDEDDQLNFGYLSGYEGLSSIVVDFSAAPASSTQAVYIRLIQTTGSYGNRVFWNPQSTGSEYVNNVGTQMVAGWEVTIQDNSAAAPGNGEWVKIWQVVMNGSQKIASITDVRHLYFEGDMGGVLQEWGTGNDRNAARGAYGVQDLHKWVQAVNQQLKSIIGGSGWYEAPPTDLSSITGTAGRFVTVDQPGGPGGDGNYATLAAAISALNSADGGTIVLLEGTYSLTSSQSIGKSINIVGLGENVIIRNDLVSGTSAMLSFSSAAASLKNVQLTEGSSNEFALYVYDGPFYMENVTVNGRTNFYGVSDGVVCNNCKFYNTASPSASYETVKIDFLGSRVLFNNCFLTGANSYQVIYINSTPFGGTSPGSLVTLNNCRVIASNMQGLNVNYCNKFTAINCSFICKKLPDGGTNGRILIYTNEGDHSFINCTVQIDLDGGATTWTQPLIQFNNNGIGDRLLIDGLRIDLNNQISACSNYYDAPVFFDCYRAVVKNMDVYNIKLPNTFTNSFAFNTVELNPQAGGRIQLQSCSFRGISHEGSQESDVNVLGNHSTATGTGSILIKDCDFDGTSQVYYHVSNECCLVKCAGAAERVTISDCEFIDGYWYSPIYIIGMAALIKGNMFTFENMINNLPFIIACLGPGLSDGRDSLCTVVNNIIYRRELVFAAISQQNYNRTVTAGNIDDSMAATSINSLELNTINSATVHGNNFDRPISLTSVAFTKPVDLAAIQDHNITF